MAVRVPLIVKNGRVEELEPTEKIKNCTETLEFDFSTASASWVILHNLDKHPTVSTVDSAGNIVHGAVIYNSPDQVTVIFKQPVAGKAYIN